MSMALHPLDVSLIVLLMAGWLWLGHRGRTAPRMSGPSTNDAVDYILAGRSLTAPFFAASLIATWYGAVLGAGEFIARYGVVMILCFGIPYYLAAAVYATVLAQRIRSSETVSIADQFRRAYGERVGYLAAVLILVLSIPAPYMLTLGIVVSSLTPLSIPWSIIAGSVVALAIVARGGLRSDVYANAGQVVIMYAGFLALVVASIAHVGSPVEMWQQLPVTHRSIPGGLEWSAIAVWFLIALQTMVDPNFHMRAAAARSAETARKGLWWSIAGWVVFDSLQLLAGLYAVVGVPAGQPAALYLNMAVAVLPPGWLGLFVSSLLAAVISTLDGYALVSATTIGHDLIDRVRGAQPRRSSVITGLLLTGVVGTAVAIIVPSIVDLIMHAASIAVPALLLPLLLSYRSGRPRAYRHQRIITWMLIPSLLSVAAMVLSAFTASLALPPIPPMLIGVAASVLLMPYALRTSHSRSHP